MKKKSLLCLALLLALSSGCKPSVRSDDPQTVRRTLPAAEAGAHRYTNQLIHAQSPYLLEHAHNPVNWQPWGEAAFAQARQEHKPIFLSVGYSSCHWCHVMERESFENPQIAKILNANFVCVLVDREERPDVDSVYMTFVQATTGSGGWPMCVWLTPDLKPFFGGTYFPPEQLAAVSEKIAAAWQTNRDQIVASGDAITRQLQQFTEANHHPSGTVLERALPEKACEQFKANYDSINGGFGGAPKFPQPAILKFLLNYHARTGATNALDMVLFTLRQMAAGGIHDQLGGGFHRYATDARWEVPHFEKMLYDQAQLAGVYLDAYQITHDEFYAGTARDILGYVQRDLTGVSGRFYSAEDADSPLPDQPAVSAEGAFYVWKKSEIDGVLGQASAPVFDYYYGVEPAGNVDNDPRGEFQNQNILMVSHTLAATAKKFGQSPEKIRELLADARQRLLAVRAKRPRPFLDNKTITAWNGLMISAFARAYQVLGDPAYLAAARRDAAFIRTKLYHANTGTLDHSYAGGTATVKGFADDYAFLTQGLLDLYEAGFDVHDLEWAARLQQTQNQLFWDTNHAGYFSTTASDPNILLRLKNNYDGAEPSPNSVSALNLLRLGELLDDKSFRDLAGQMLTAFSGQLAQSPGAMPQMLVALDFQLTPPKQIVIAGQLNAADTQAMLRAVNQLFLPDKIVLLADGGDGQAFLAKHLDFIRDVKPIQDHTTAFVCENYVCQLPTTNLVTILKNIGSK